MAVPPRLHTSVAYKLRGASITGGWFAITSQLVARASQRSYWTGDPNHEPEGWSSGVHVPHVNAQSLSRVDADSSHSPSAAAWAHTGAPSMSRQGSTSGSTVTQRQRSSSSGMPLRRGTSGGSHATFSQVPAGLFGSCASMERVQLGAAPAAATFFCIKARPRLTQSSYATNAAVFSPRLS